MSLTLLLATLVLGAPADRDLIDKIQAELIEMERLTSHSQWGNPDAARPMRMDGDATVRPSSTPRYLHVSWGEDGAGILWDIQTQRIFTFDRLPRGFGLGQAAPAESANLPEANLAEIGKQLFGRLLQAPETPHVSRAEPTGISGYPGFVVSISARAFGARTKSYGSVILDPLSGDVIRYYAFSFPQRKFAQRGRNGERVSDEVALSAAVDAYLRTNPFERSSEVMLHLTWVSPSRHKVLAAEFTNFETENERNGVEGLYWEVSFSGTGQDAGWQRVFVDAVTGRAVSVVLDDFFGSPGSEGIPAELPKAGRSVAMIGGKRFEITLTNVSKSELESSRPNAALLQGEERIWPVRIDAGKLKGLGFEADFESESELPEAQELEPFGD